jgi:hypothetical protein
MNPQRAIRGAVAAAAVAVALFLGARGTIADSAGLEGLEGDDLGAGIGGLGEDPGDAIDESLRDDLPDGDAGDDPLGIDDSRDPVDPGLVDPAFDPGIPGGGDPDFDPELPDPGE